MLRAVPFASRPLPFRFEIPPDVRFAAAHLWLPLLAGLLLVALLQAGPDRALADALLRLQGGHWAWRDAPLLAIGLHRGGRLASLLAWLLLAAWWVLRAGAASRIEAQHAGTSVRRAELRRAAAYVLAAVAAATAAVALLKSVTNVDCPWALARYGGAHPWLGLFDARPADWARARCFPAGHASAGYAWLALYFAALEVAPRLRMRALCFGLGAGLAFGIAQQLRGAHFASHDVASALVCWLVAFALWKAWPWTPAARERAA